MPSNAACNFRAKSDRNIGKTATERLQIGVVTPMFRHGTPSLGIG